MAEQSQGIPYVSEVKATLRSGFAVRAPAPILIQEKLHQLFISIDDTDDVDSDVPVEMGPSQGLWPWSRPNGRSGESRSSASMHLILNLNLEILF